MLSTRDFADVLLRLHDQIAHQDNRPCGEWSRRAAAAAATAGYFSATCRMQPREHPHFAQLLDIDQPGAHAVVDVVIVVGDGIGEVRKLRLESGLRAIEESLADIAEQPRVLHGAMLEHAFAAFEREIEAGELRVAFLEFIDDSQRLQVVLEAAVFAHAFVERVLAGVAERRVPEVVREADGLGQRFIDVAARARRCGRSAQPRANA